MHKEFALDSPPKKEGRYRYRRNPFRHPKGDQRRQYAVTLDYLNRRLLPFLEEKASGESWLADTLREIVSYFQGITFYGGKKRCLCYVAEICVAYPRPMVMLAKFRDAYKLIKKITDDAKAGRKCELFPGKEEEARRFMQNVERFTSITGLCEMRRNACLSMNGSFSTYGIDFPTWQQLERLVVGAGPQCALSKVEPF